MLIRHVMTAGLIGAIGWGVASAQHQVELFSNDARPVTGIDNAVSAQMIVQHYNLDAPDHLEAELSAGLSADPEAAAREAQAMLDQLGEDRLRERVEVAYRGHLRAAELGVDRIPAVVFDRQAVVYGVTELREAIRHYRRWLARGEVPDR